MPSAMSPPSTAAGTPSPSFDSSLNDDSSLESEMLLFLCKNTLAEADSVAQAMRACISECFSALNADLFGSEIETPLCLPISDGDEMCDSEMIELPDSLLDESIVPETLFELEGLPESKGAFQPWNCSRKRKHPDSVTRTAMAGLASAKADETEGDWGDEMLRILLPAYFRLMRSFPCAFFLLRNWGKMKLVGLCVVGNCWYVGAAVLCSESMWLRQSEMMSSLHTHKILGMILLASMIFI